MELLNYLLNIHKNFLCLLKIYQKFLKLSINKRVFLDLQVFFIAQFPIVITKELFLFCFIDPEAVYTFLIHVYIAKAIFAFLILDL